MGVHLRLAEVSQEIATLKKVAHAFFERGTGWQFDELRSMVLSLQGGPAGRAMTLELPPVRTRWSAGDYEPGQRKGKPVVAQMSGVWDVCSRDPLGTGGKKSAKKKRAGEARSAGRLIEFTGVASLKTEVFDGNENRLAMWKTEHGDAQSPGCHFHVQILQDSPDPPFPKSLPVPRFPTVFVSPMSAIEHTLGELFQDKWTKALSANGGDEVQYWRKLQRTRLRQLFKWQRDAVDDAISSPWGALKDAMPTASTFADGGDS